MTKNTNNTYLFIDGSNLYAGQYELFGPHKYIDFSLFVKKTENKLGIIFDKIFFYASYSPQLKKPTKKQKLYLKNEALFYKSVRSIKKLTFFRGYRSKTSGKEKEVDVKLAVDIVHFAHLNKYDNMYLFSGDADFMHALKIAQELKKTVSILAIQNRLPVRFSYNFPTCLILFDQPASRLKQFTRQKIKQVQITNDILKRI